MREGDLLAALRASIALPGLITPSQWGGRWMVDGGLVNPVPVSLCRALGADSVIAVDLNTTLLARRSLGGKPAKQVSEDAPSDEIEDEEPSGELALGARLNGLLRDLAADIRERIGGDAADEGPAMPTLYDVMANAVNIMQVRIGRSRMAGDPPELLIAPRMNDFAILDSRAQRRNSARRPQGHPPHRVFRGSLGHAGGPRGRPVPRGGTGDRLGPLRRLWGLGLGRDGDNPV